MVQFHHILTDSEQFVCTYIARYIATYNCFLQTFRSDTEIKKTGTGVSTFRSARGASQHHLEIPSGKRTTTGNDQFNSPKLIDKLFHPKEHAERKKSKRKRKPNPAWLSDYLDTGDPPLKPSSCCALSQTFSFARCQKKKKNCPHKLCTPSPCQPRLSNNYPCSKRDTPTHHSTLAQRLPFQAKSYHVLLPYFLSHPQAS